MEELTLQIWITIVKTRNTGCFTNSHESFETFQFKYTNQVYDYVYENFFTFKKNYYSQGRARDIKGDEKRKFPGLMLCDAYELLYPF